MASRRIAALAAAALTAFWSVSAQSGTIYWTLDQSCGQFNSPVTSPDAPPCVIGVVNVSICPASNIYSPQDAYSTNKEINITGYQISALSYDGRGDLQIIIGAAKAGTTTDVFATCAGTGSFSCKGILTMPMPQGGTPSVDGDHIDVYAYCGGSSNYHIVVILEYWP